MTARRPLLRLRTAVGLCVVSVQIGALARAAAGTSAAPEKFEFCEQYYEVWQGFPRDFEKAFDCFRRQEDWLWVALMQVNGEGTPADLAAARASLDRLKFKDADALELEAIIMKREAHPTAETRRVDFCRDVASTTLSANGCQAQEQAKKKQKSDTRLKRIRDSLDARVRSTFDRAQAAFGRFVMAEGDRVYQEFIEGSIRNQGAMDQEARARRNFLAAIELLMTGSAPPLPGQRSFSEADRELNRVYKSNVADYVSFNERAAKDALGMKAPGMVAEYLGRSTDYKTKSRAVQHEWVRYRDAMAGLAAARWPDLRGVRDLARALVTEDRIRELRGK